MKPNLRRVGIAGLMFAALAGVNLPAQLQVPDFHAFAAANNVKEPAARVEALTRFLKEHPDSEATVAAVSSLMSAAAKAWPDEPAKLVAIGDDFVNGAKDLGRAQGARTIAAALLSAGKSADAERFARIGVDGLTFETFQKSKTGRGSTVTVAALESEFAAARAQQLATLGEAETKLGKDTEARKLFLAAAQDDPTSTAAAHGLADLSAKAGDGAQDLRWTELAYLAHPSAADRDRLLALYKKAHNGDAAGLESFLDAEYPKLLPNPAHLERYRGKAKRLVLAELLTGSGCPPCVGMDLAFDALMERYQQSDVAFLMYHENRPKPDPMTFPGSMERFTYLGAHGVPSVAIDGKSHSGGGGREAAIEWATHYAGEIDEALQVEPRAGFTLKASRNGSLIPVTVNITRLDPGAKQVKLHVVLAENLIRFGGENGIRIHPMVVRGVIQVPVEGPAEIGQTFDLVKLAADLKSYHDAFEKHDDQHNPDGTFRWPNRLENINPADLTVVAFLEDDSTKAVLGTGWINLAATSRTHEE